MKTLSEALSNISRTAEKTTNSPVEQQSSLIKSGGNVIMVKQLTPEQNTDNLVQYLKNTLKLQINTDSKVKYTEYGCEFIPNIEFGKMTPEQKEQATRMIDSYFTPLPDVEIVKLIARLQIISPEREKHSIDREARTAIWVDELRQYPADIVTKVLKKRYRWFPTLAEVLTDCDFEVEYRNLIRQKLRS